MKTVAVLVEKNQFNGRDVIRITDGTNAGNSIELSVSDAERVWFLLAQVLAATVKDA